VIRNEAFGVVRRFDYEKDYRSFLSALRVGNLRCQHPNFRLLWPGFHEPPISQVEAVL